MLMLPLAVMVVVRPFVLIGRPHLTPASGASEPLCQMIEETLAVGQRE
jgi:hypothetical protein